MSNIFEKILSKNESISHPSLCTEGSGSKAGERAKYHKDGSATSHERRSCMADTAVQPSRTDLLSFMSQKKTDLLSLMRKNAPLANVQKSNGSPAAEIVECKEEAVEVRDPSPPTEVSIATGNSSSVESSSNANSLDPKLLAPAKSRPLQLNELTASSTAVSRSIDEFLADEYGDELDMEAILLATFGEQDTSETAPPDSENSHLESAKTPASEDAALLKRSSALANLGLCSSSTRVSPEKNKSQAKATPECDSEVQNFNSLNGMLLPDEYTPHSKRPRAEAPASKIEFCASQFTSSYHKWKSTVSVPTDLVRKLPKPILQPRLPPELADNSIGSQVLKSSLNITFKKAATTKAELRFDALSKEQATGTAPSNAGNTEQSGSSACNKRLPVKLTEQCTETASSNPGKTRLPGNSAFDSRPPVKLILKTSVGDSKLKKYVIVSCSNSARCELSRQPRDDSDSDSCSRGSGNARSSLSGAAKATAFGQSQPVQSNGSQQNGSNHSGKERSQTLCLCSLQPVVRLKRQASFEVGSRAPQVDPGGQTFFASQKWQDLQTAFKTVCNGQDRTAATTKTGRLANGLSKVSTQQAPKASSENSPQLSAVKDAPTASATTDCTSEAQSSAKCSEDHPGVVAEQSSKVALELRRISDSADFCAFSNIPNRREQQKVARLYYSLVNANTSSSLPRKNVARSRGSKPSAAPKKENGTAVRDCRRQRIAKQQSKTLKAIRARMRLPGCKQLRVLKSSLTQNITNARRKTDDSAEPPSSELKQAVPSSLPPLLAACFDKKSGMPINDHFGRSPLHIAMLCDDHEGLSFIVDLFKRDGKLDCKDNENSTPLHTACIYGNTKGAETLLQAGSSVNERGGEAGNTPLHEAVIQANFSIVQVLVDFGADLTCRNYNNETALDLETSSEVSQFLKDLYESSVASMTSTDFEMLHSNRRLPTVYVVHSQSSPSGARRYVLQSELCTSLGISKEYFCVHHKPNMKVSTVSNSTFASQIINPDLQASFERSTVCTDTSSVVEVDEYFTSLFSSFRSAEGCSQGVESASVTPLKLQPSLAPAPASSDTDEMTDEDFVDDDECQIRIDDVKEMNRSLRNSCPRSRRSCKKKQVSTPPANSFHTYARTTDLAAKPTRQQKSGEKRANLQHGIQQKAANSARSDSRQEQRIENLKPCDRSFGSEQHSIEVYDSNDENSSSVGEIYDLEFSLEDEVLVPQAHQVSTSRRKTHPLLTSASCRVPASSQASLQANSDGEKGPASSIKAQFAWSVPLHRSSQQRNFADSGGTNSSDAGDRSLTVNKARTPARSGGLSPAAHCDLPSPVAMGSALGPSTAAGLSASVQQGATFCCGLVDVCVCMATRDA